MPFLPRRAVNVLLAPACSEPWLISRAYRHLARDELAPEVIVLVVPPGSEWVLPILRKSFNLKYRWVRVEGVELSGQVEEWLEAVCHALSAVNPDLVSVLISCSTPELAALLTSIAQMVPLDGVYSVIMATSGERLERWRSAILSWDKVGEHVIEEIFWPEQDDYEIHRLPILPLPPALLESVMRILSGRYQRADGELVAWLVGAGLIEVGVTGEARATELGRAVFRAISILTGAGDEERPVLRWR